MYYVSGIVKDEKGVGIARAVVSNGKKGIFTDKDGNYSIESDIYNNKIRISKMGYLTQTIDLSKYQNDSSVNGSVTLQFDIASSLNPNATEEKSSTSSTEEKGLTKTQMRNLGFGMIGVALLLTSFLVYRAVKN